MGESPVKKLNYDPVDKENIAYDTAPVVSDAELKKAHVDVIEKGQKPVVAPTIKPHEADEPLLQENPHRFVLFPIKYHEVRVSNASTRKVLSTTHTDMIYRYGKCTRKPKHLSGQRRRSIYQRISTTGTAALTMTRSTLSLTSSPSSPRQMVSSMKISSSASAERSRYPKHVASTVSRS